MEFSELKKVWDEQNSKPLYIIDQDTLHNTVQKKKKVSARRVSMIEIGLMLINTFAGTFLLVDAIVDNEGFWDYAGAIALLLTVLFLGSYRFRRKKREKVFDRSIKGELEHAIANSDSIIQISTLMVTGYLLPILLISVTKMIVLGASIQAWLIIGISFPLAYFVIRLEQKKIHEPYKKRLLDLRAKLLEEV
jgi:hypothetical protein